GRAVRGERGRPVGAARPVRPDSRREPALPAGLDGELAAGADAGARGDGGRAVRRPAAGAARGVRAARRGGAAAAAGGGPGRPVAGPEADGDHAGRHGGELRARLAGSGRAGRRGDRRGPSHAAVGAGHRVDAAIRFGSGIVIVRRLDTGSGDYRRRREAMLAKLAELDAEHAKAVSGGGPKYVDRHRGRGKLLRRERIELLVDPDSPFLELSPLAAWGSDFQVGASVVTGIGAIEGVECVISANDPTVRGGASNPWTLRKTLRAADIAFENRLPFVNLVESGGADLPTQKEIFIPGGRVFRDLTRLSAAGIPTIALVFGNSTAGGAYVPGMSDYTVMVRERAKVF